MVTVEIQIEYYIKNKTISKWWSNQVSFLITSLKNSPGSYLWKWKDGKQLQIAMNKNNHLQYSTVFNHKLSNTYKKMVNVKNSHIMNALHLN